MDREKAVRLADLLTDEGAGVGLFPERLQGQLPNEWEWEVIVDLETASVGDLKRILKTLELNDLNGNLENDRLRFR